MTIVLTVGYIKLTTIRFPFLISEVNVQPGVFQNTFCSNTPSQPISYKKLFASFTGADGFPLPLVSTRTCIAYVLLRKMCTETQFNSPQYSTQYANSLNNFATFQQANCENNEIVEQEKSLKNTSQMLSCTQHPKMDPPTSASTAPDFHTYENICCSKGTAHSRFSPANNGDEQYANTVIYIKPLPPLSGRTVKGCLRKPTNEPTETTNAKDQPTESCTSNAPTCQSRAVTEVRPGSLWFGLNLSKIE